VFKGFFLRLLAHRSALGQAKKREVFKFRLKKKKKGQMN